MYSTPKRRVVGPDIVASLSHYPLIDRDMMMVPGAQFDKHAAKSNSFAGPASRGLAVGRPESFLAGSESARKRARKRAIDEYFMSYPHGMGPVCATNCSTFGCIMLGGSMKRIIHLDLQYAPLMVLEFVEKISQKNTPRINVNSKDDISGPFIIVTCNFHSTFI